MLLLDSFVVIVWWFALTYKCNASRVEIFELDVCWSAR